MFIFIPLLNTVFWLNGNGFDAIMRSCYDVYMYTRKKTASKKIFEQKQHQQSFYVCTIATIAYLIEKTA